MTKKTKYSELVADRKDCQLCTELTNPAEVEDGRFDSANVGPWSSWQGNLDASLMVVGQDWGDISYFIRRQGGEDPSNPTNLGLVELVGIAGMLIGNPDSAVGRDVAFFTNAILCLKNGQGGLQGKVKPTWFKNCAPFLRRQIEIVRPVVVSSLGEHAYRAILEGFGMSCGSFRSEVDLATGRLLPNGSRAFAMYHCGARIRNTHRPMAMQKEDWKRLRPYLMALNQPLEEEASVMTEEKMNAIIERFDTDREFRASVAFLDGGPDQLSARLHRAALNQLCEGEATVSRYAIWANTVRDNIRAADAEIVNGNISEAHRLLHRAANSLSAFAEIQSHFDPLGIGKPTQQVNKPDRK